MNDYISEINPDWNAYPLFQLLRNYMALYDSEQKGEEVTTS